MKRLFAMLALVLATPAFAAGELDPEFGDGGRLIVQAHETLPFLQPTEDVYGFDVLVDHAERIVMVGSAIGKDPGPSEVPGYEWGLVGRLLSDGSLDPQFNGGALRALGVEGRGFRFYDVAEQADGRLLVYGYTLDYSDWQNNYIRNAPVVCRIEENGSLDTSFGGLGCRTLESVGERPALTWLFFKDTLSDKADAIAVQDDGKILVLGGIREPDPDSPRSFAMVRLNPDGSDDLSFGDTACANPAPRCGMTFSPPGWQGIDPRAIALDPAQGRIVVAGHAATEFYEAMLVMRFDTNGDFELTFEPVNFSYQLGPDTTHTVTAVKVLQDSSVALLGSAFPSIGDPLVALAKFDAMGALDDGFGVMGGALYKEPNLDEGYLGVDLAVQSNGKLLVAGVLRTGDGNLVEYSRVWRVDPVTGALDSHFGDAGMARLGLVFDEYDAGNTSKYFTHGIAAGAHSIVVVGSYRGFEPGDTDANPFLFRIDQSKLFSDGFE